MFKILSLTFRVFNFRVIKKRQKFHATITFFFLLRFKHKLIDFLSISKWLEGFLDLRFQRGCKQTFLVPNFLIYIYGIEIG
jgi:hypothetical protein